MTRDAGSQTEPLPPSRPRTIVLAAFFMMFVGGVVALGGVVWGVAVPRDPSNPLLRRVVCAGLAVALTGVAAKKFFWDSSRSRRSRWQRISAVLVLLLAAYMVVLAIRRV